MLKRLIPFEAFIWMAGLIALILISPSNDSHFTFCFFKNVGIDFCPGCGLGKSISYLFHGKISASFEAHPLGTVAAIVLSLRIYSLIKRQIQNYKSIYTEV
ncbi:MAG: DUF2752 domain-containing protein [Ignavibacteria bacterium]|nr:DUF2752 domain-containing protein [Ignavibacteria bacterium]